MDVKFWCLRVVVTVIVYILNVLYAGSDQESADDGRRWVVGENTNNGGAEESWQLAVVSWQWDTGRKNGWRGRF